MAKLVYTVGKRGGGVRHADNGSGHPLCQQKHHSGGSVGFSFVLDEGEVECKRCLRLLANAQPFAVMPDNGITEAEHDAAAVEAFTDAMDALAIEATETITRGESLFAHAVPDTANAEVEQLAAVLPDPDDEPGVIELFRKAVETPALAWIMGIDVDKARAALAELDALAAVEPDTASAADVTAATDAVIASDPPFAVGDRVEVVDALHSRRGQNGIIVEIDLAYSELHNRVWFDDGAEYQFAAHELRKLDTPTPDPRDTEIVAGDKVMVIDEESQWCMVQGTVGEVKDGKVWIICEIYCGIEARPDQLLKLDTAANLTTALRMVTDATTATIDGMSIEVARLQAALKPFADIKCYADGENPIEYLYRTGDDEAMTALIEAAREALGVSTGSAEVAQLPHPLIQANAALMTEREELRAEVARLRAQVEAGKQGAVNITAQLLDWAGEQLDKKQQQYDAEIARLTERIAALEAENLGLRLGEASAQGHALDYLETEIARLQAAVAVLMEAANPVLGHIGLHGNAEYDQALNNDTLPSASASLMTIIELVHLYRLFGGVVKARELLGITE